MKDVTLHLRFPDLRTCKIYNEKILATAVILAVHCKIYPAPYGEEEMYARVVVGGEPEDVEMLIDFINDSMGLIEE